MRLKPKIGFAMLVAAMILWVEFAPLFVSGNVAMVGWVVACLAIGHFLLSWRVVALSRDRAVISVYWGLQKKTLRRHQWGLHPWDSDWFDDTGKSMHGDALTDLAIARGLMWRA